MTPVEEVHGSDGPEKGEPGEGVEPQEDEGAGMDKAAFEKLREGGERLGEVSAAMDRDQTASEKLERDSRGSAEDAARTRLLQRVQVDFTYHPPTSDVQIGKYADLRSRAMDLAKAMVVHCPSSRELSTALTLLEGSVMHANASIARHG